MYTQQKFYVVTFSIDISFKITDGKESFYIFNVDFKCHIDQKRKNEHNPFEITLV